MMIVMAANMSEISRVSARLVLPKRLVTIFYPIIPWPIITNEIFTGFHQYIHIVLNNFKIY